MFKKVYSKRSHALRLDTVPEHLFILAVVLQLWLFAGIVVGRRWRRVVRPAAVAQHELQQAPRRRELVGEGLVSEDLGVRKYTTFRSKGTIFHIFVDEIIDS